MKVGKGKAGRGLKAKNSNRAKPNPIRPPELSVIPKNVVKSTVHQMTTKKNATASKSTVDAVIESVARGEVSSDSDNVSHRESERIVMMGIGLKWRVQVPS